MGLPEKDRASTPDEPPVFISPCHTTYHMSFTLITISAGRRGHMAQAYLAA